VQVFTKALLQNAIIFVQNISQLSTLQTQLFEIHEILFDDAHVGNNHIELKVGSFNQTFPHVSPIC